ncbi:dnaJ homolog subfamily C member 28-like [Amphiura filiformis]|uniref:dnaJ homolog subfamily C member 28-like n=1 Tax=Amphiura filiformis TaxID=82378 RepID=UPI003B21DE5B
MAASHLSLCRSTPAIIHPYRRHWTALGLTSFRTVNVQVPLVLQGVTLFRTTSTQPFHKAKHLKLCFRLLEVQEDCTLTEAKEAYLQLAKKYHPDGQAKMANPQSFSELKEAYQTVCMHLQKEESSVQDTGDEEIDVKHTAPQHRQFLAFEGIGTGTPIQREKQYQAYRALRAANLAMDHKVEKLAYQDESALVVKDKKAAQKIKTTNTLDRMVEDLVQKSMADGDFDNLPGSGKPLPDRTHYCPFIDINQHNLNQVMVNNGYVPEWIRMEKEIRFDLQDMKEALLKERLKLGPEPLNKYNENKWKGLIDAFAADIASINKKIDHLNLIVPIIRLQMVHFKVEKELDKVVKQYDEVKPDETEQESGSTGVDGTGNGKLYQLFEKLSEKIGSRIMQL